MKLAQFISHFSFTQTIHQMPLHNYVFHLGISLNTFTS